MVDYPPQFEQQDNVGTTIHISGTATTTPTDYPSSPGNKIQRLMLDNLGNKTIKFSVDGGTNYKSVVKGGAIVKTLRGNIRQIKIKTDSSTSEFDGFIDAE